MSTIRKIAASTVLAGVAMSPFVGAVTANAATISEINRVGVWTDKAPGDTSLLGIYSYSPWSTPSAGEVNGTEQHLGICLDSGKAIPDTTVGDDKAVALTDIANNAIDPANGRAHGTQFTPDQLAWLFAKHGKDAYMAGLANPSSEGTYQAAAVSYLIKKEWDSSDTFQYMWDHIDGNNNPTTGRINPPGTQAKVQAYVDQYSKEMANYKAYGLAVTASGGSAVGKAATITGTVTGHIGEPVANEKVTFTVNDGGKAVTLTGTTNAQGVATVSYTPTTAGTLSVDAKTDNNLPEFKAFSYAATSGSNQQDMFNVKTLYSTASGKASLIAAPAPKGTVGTQVNDQTAIPGQKITDTATVTDLEAGVSGKVTPVLWVKKAGATEWTKVSELPAVDVKGNGTYPGLGAYTIPADSKPGDVYSYSEILVTSDGQTITHNANHDDEKQATTVSVPVIETMTDKQVAGVGKTVADTIKVTGTGGSAGALTASLYGYLPSADGTLPTDAQWREAIKAGTVKPIATETIQVKGDGEYKTKPVTLTQGGYVTWYEEFTPTDAPGTTTKTPYGVKTESTLVVNPKVSTVAQSTSAHVGAEMRDNVKVEGLSGQSGTITGAIYGPMAPAADGTCNGLDWSKATVAGKIDPIKVTKDGVYQTNPTTIKVAGCYTYDEAFTPDNSNLTVVNTKRGETPETKLFTEPLVSTVAKGTNSYVGAKMTDNVDVVGMNGSTGVVSGKLLGPVAPNAAGTCTNLDWTKAPVADSIKPIKVAKDGVYTTSPTTIKTAGCYTYQESLLIDGSKTPVVNTKPGESTETLLFKVKPSTPVTPEKPSTPVVHARVNSGEAGANFTDKDGVAGGAAAIVSALAGLGALVRRRKMNG